jgi:hypothetical protein
MPVHSADASTASERRFASHEASPRSPASPDPSYRPASSVSSKKSILEDRSKVLVALTSTGRRADDRLGEAAKVDILTVDPCSPKFRAGVEICGSPFQFKNVVEK